MFTRGLEAIWILLGKSRVRKPTRAVGEHATGLLTSGGRFSLTDSKQTPLHVFDETVLFSEKELTKMPLSKVRYLPGEFAQFQETVIVGDLVAITIFAENAYSVLIRDSVVAEGYKQNFELLWKSVKP